VRAVQLDFVPEVRPGVWMWRTAGIAFVVGVGLCLATFEQRAEVSRVRAEVTRLQAEGVAPTTEESTPARDELYSGSARQMFAEGSTEWPGALRTLEVIEVDDVRIVGLDLSTPERRIRIEVRFSDLAQLLRYLSDLNSGDPILRWTLEQTMSPGEVGGQSAAFLVANLGE
jgi:hypothetical protein